MHTFIKATHQQWKLWLGLWWIPVASLAAIHWSLAGASGQSDGLRLAVAVAALVAAGVGYSWTVLTVKCPQCATKLLWTALRDHNLAEWLRWIATLTECPSCGSVGMQVK